MSQKTIQCHLVAQEPSRRTIWQLTAGKNTPLINELLHRIAIDTRFEDWCSKGSVPQKVVSDEFCNPLRDDCRFKGQPGRFYTSAVTTVCRIFKSWIRIRGRLIHRLEGQTRWLEMLQSDEDLTQACNCDLQTLQEKTAEILAQTTPQPAEARTAKSSKKKQKSKLNGQKQSFDLLFEQYQETDDELTRSAIVYLLKNGRKLPNEPEDPKQFAKRRRKAEIRVERTTNTLHRMQLPTGRDMTDQEWLKTLATAVSNVPEDDGEAASWQAILMSEAHKLPFPILYE